MQYICLKISSHIFIFHLYRKLWVACPPSINPTFCWLHHWSEPHTTQHNYACLLWIKWLVDCKIGKGHFFGSHVKPFTFQMTLLWNGAQRKQKWYGSIVVEVHTSMLVSSTSDSCSSLKRGLVRCFQKSGWLRSATSAASCLPCQSNRKSDMAAWRR